MDLRATETSDIRRWATCALWEMEQLGVPPTPANFDLWFRNANGSDSDLSSAIAAKLKNVPTLSAADLEILHSDFPGPRGPADEFADHVDEMSQAAQSMVDNVATNADHLRQYGDALSKWTANFAQPRTAENLVQAAATLAVETVKAVQRNRILEQQLSESSARIARLRNSISTLKKEATTDSLTGLCNRRAFNARLRRACLEAKTDAQPVSVLLIDVDHFKRVNDTYGHRAGDMVLRLIGRLLLQDVKGRDTAARYGGEEFAVLLLGANLKGAATVAEQIRAAMEGKQLIGKTAAEATDKITISIGVAQFQPSESVSTLLDRADAAMYRAKQQGRNRVCTQD